MLVCFSDSVRFRQLIAALLAPGLLALAFWAAWARDFWWLLLVYPALMLVGGLHAAGAVSSGGSMGRDGHDNVSVLERLILGLAVPVPQASRVTHEW